MGGTYVLYSVMRILLVLVLIVAAGCNSVGDQSVAAVVNGYKISNEELDRYFQSQISENESPPGPDQAQMIRLNLLRELIDRQLLLQKAEELGLMAVEAEVNARLKDYRAPFADDAEFEASLRDRAMTLEDLRTEIRRTLTIEKLFNRQITAQIKITEAELQQHYDDSAATFTLAEEQLHLAQIVVTPEPETPTPNLLNDDAKDDETASAKIEMIAERLAQGEDFATLAQNYSEDPVTTPNGGDLGFIPKSSLDKADIALRRVVAALSPGDISPVVEADGQYRILQLIDREAAGQREFSDPRVQQVLRETLRNRRDQLLKAALIEAARSNARIDNYLARRIVSDFGVDD